MSFTTARRFSGFHDSASVSTVQRSSCPRLSMFSATLRTSARTSEVQPRGGESEGRTAWRGRLRSVELHLCVPVLGIVGPAFDIIIKRICPGPARNVRRRLTTVWYKSFREDGPSAPRIDASEGDGKVHFFFTPVGRLPCLVKRQSTSSVFSTSDTGAKRIAADCVFLSCLRVFFSMADVLLSAVSTSSCRTGADHDPPYGFSSARPR